jgi:hypothetical protein
LMLMNVAEKFNSSELIRSLIFLKVQSSWQNEGTWCGRVHFFRLVGL